MAKGVAGNRALCLRRPADRGHRPAVRAGLAALNELRPTASFYATMDNFPEFHQGLSRRAMRRHEYALAAKVDLIVASSTFLAESLRAADFASRRC